MREGEEDEKVEENELGSLFFPSLSDQLTTIAIPQKKHYIVPDRAARALARYNVENNNGISSSLLSRDRCIQSRYLRHCYRAIHSGMCFPRFLPLLRQSSYISQFLQAIEIDSNNAKYYDARASAYEKLGKLQEGLLDARQVIRLLPTISKVGNDFLILSEDLADLVPLMKGYLRAARLLKQAKKYANAEKLLVQAEEKVSKRDEKGIMVRFVVPT